jgi:hypothetical protein
MPDTDAPGRLAGGIDGCELGVAERLMPLADGATVSPISAVFE